MGAAVVATLHRKRRGSIQSFCVLLGIVLGSILPRTAHCNSQQRRDVNDDQPRIVTVGGNLIFQTGINHNITFRPGGTGSVVIDGEDLRQLITLAKESRTRIEQLESGASPNVDSRLRSLEDNRSTLDARFVELTNRVIALENNLNNSEGSRRINRRVSQLEDQVERLNQLLTANECQSSPCRNGGTCIDLYNAFSCQCIPGWTGSLCENDVNECAILVGTDLGCQNGATCENTLGSFRCTCTANWFGSRCTEAHDDCTTASNEALCGHGTCQNLPRDSPGQVKYRCHCDVGWTTDGVRPQCNTDVNECNGPRPPCSTNPTVMCINTLGSFVCGPCPAGYSGNGYLCNDINECEINNGGCSLAPRVRCINTPGSRQCDACPPGYQGDGVNCNFVGVCGQGNGGCHPMATCRETPGILGRSCSCPGGYVGDGVGSNGCVPLGQGGGPCDNNPCIHGSCQPAGATYSCVCSPGWTGFNCNQQLDGCVSNPCRNGGTCTGRADGSYTCSCTASYTGPNCQQPQQTCGGRLSGESGGFRFPRMSTETYPHGVSCAWVITTSPNKIITLTFTQFKLESSPNCNFDFLQIHDGPTASSHMIGKYCGARAPNGGSLNTTSYQVYMWFRSDASVSSDGFEVVWNSALPTCGGLLRGSDSGVITSPGYPGSYPDNRDCQWYVFVPLGKTIRFTFGFLAIERHPNCSYDYLEIRDGFRQLDPLLQRYCTSAVGLPQPVETTGPYATVRFHSDDSQTDRGFLITYSSLQGCGGTYTSDNGVLISPNYPNPYPHNAQCVWTISVPSGEVITFNITNIDVEVHRNCLWDYVEVREGLDERGAFVGRYCGNNTPPVYVTTQNNLWIKFKTDPSNRGAGFRATWIVACGGVYTNATGELRSPYFPNPYPTDRECFYVIRQTEGTTITMTFVSFDVEASFGGNCTYDFVEVRSGQTADGTLIGRYCGSSLPGPIQSPSNALWIRFKSDGSRQNHGFRATYTTANTGVIQSPESSCGGTLTTLVGVLQSPRHPNVYPHGVNCTWFITVNPGFIIRLTFMTFSLESNYRCAYDYVEVFDNYTRTNSLGRFCGVNRPPVLTSSDNAMTVAFVTDSSIAREGFSATYISLNASTVCGGDFRSEVGIVTSPNYPGNYPHNRICEWTITVPSGRQILLNITDFIMESHGGCQFDYLEIRNGGFETSPLIGRYCGQSIDQIIRSQSNRLFLKMQTDYSIAHRGFRLYYDGTVSGCGGDLTSVTGSFVSPNYPMAYARYSECFWQITVAQGSVINIHFSDFFLGSQWTCNYNYVEVRDTGPLGLVLGRLCGNSTPDYLQSKTNKMWVKLRTGYYTGGRGFHAVYFANCNNILRGYSGVIESPNFPRPYPGNRDCTWIVEATVGNRINASFSHFEVQAGRTNTSCNADYLELRDGADVSGRLIGHYCGQNALPPDVSTTSRWLFVRFIADSTVTHNGFRLEYVIDGCGGRLTGPTGRFTSLNYPQPYPHQRECIWTISVDPGNSVELTIHDFDVESHANCSYDALEIYGGIDQTSPQLAVLCHTQDTAQVLTSTGNNMVVRFLSDISNSGRGFNVTYRAIAGGCGGNFSARTGTIMSQNYPNAYPHNTDCLWTITVQPGRPVLLTFVDFDVEGPSSSPVGANCRLDYVAVYGTRDFNASELMKACGNALPRPPVVRSVTNQLFIRMRSDWSIAGRGFKATYKMGCGGTISAETDGQLTSPGWPNNYEILNNCTWFITTNHTGDRITLTFLHMDLENNNNNCSDDYVLVLEGNDDDAPEVGRYCGTTAPPAYTSVGSALVVKFVTDASHQRRGFQAVYTKSTSACGGDFTSEHGAFNSPGYPDSYSNNMECVWTITSSQGNSIMLSFGFFNLESSENCNNDYVEVRQGNSGGPVLGRYCGRQIPTNQTMGNQLWIKFKSNENYPGQGFMATYNSIYGGYLTGNTGQLASPLYPSNYPNNVDYAWVITVALGSRIQATFQMMQIEISQPCFFDYVRLRDGNSADSPELGKFCGVNIPDPVTTSSNQLRVEFHSDGSVNSEGFLMTWQAVGGPASIPPLFTLPPGVSTPRPQPCGGNLNATETFQTIESPGFPYGYASNLRCDWIITAPIGNRILFQFTNLTLEGTPPRCYDAVHFYEDGRWMNLFCGVTLPASPILTMVNTASVRFRTDSFGNFTGFSINFKSVCGGLIRASQGRLKTPGYPNSYPDTSNCTWTVQVPSGRTIRSAFEGSFAISGQTGLCSGDYLEVYNGDSISSPLLGRYCGSQAPSIPESSSNSLTLQFISNSDGVSAAGFSFSFSHIQLACGGSLTLTDVVTEGFIASPNYPQPYPPNTDCIWVVTAPANRRVKLDFIGEFEIEMYSGCRFDFVEVRNGGTGNSPVLGTFCGSNLPTSQVATGNVMYVRFHTDNSAAMKGFRARLSYDVCGGTISAPNGTITSPNFPASYPPNMDCEWFVQGPAGHYVTLSFEAFSLESQSNCSAGDYVEIRDYNSTGNLLLLACGWQRPAAVDTSDRFVYIRFHSDRQNSASGFKMNFMASVEECGGQLTTPYGTLTSPGYPRPYAHSRVCDWTILVAVGRKVTLAFNDMDMERTFSFYCRSDYVEVTNGQLPMSPVIGRFCGSTLPSTPIESSSNVMMVRFRTDSSVNGRGFSASYSSNSPADCGGVFNSTDTSGVIESPGFSQNISYNASEQCIWLVANRNANSSIAIQFLTLDLEHHGECSYDFVEIREGNDENGQLMNRYCRLDRSIPLLILSPLPSLWIRFVSDRVHSRTGFQLTYSFTGCGGLLTSSSGVITSPNYPSVYAPNTYCAWKVIAPEGSQIKLYFDRILFNPSTSSNCSSVYLEIFNGGLASSPSAAKYCYGTPPVFRSQSNEVRVIFYAGQEALAARGFRMTYNFDSAGCGGSIHSQEGVITSPNWPSNYNASLECTWDVSVARGYHIQWTFTAPFDMEIGNPCIADWVEISEYQNSTSLSRIGRYCGNEMPPSGSSRSNRIRIRFRSNGRNQGNGFALNFTAGCGATFTEPQGVIMSPGYPNNYGNNLNCTYNIIGDPQKYLFLTFDPEHFYVEGLKRFRTLFRDSQLLPRRGFFFGGRYRCPYDSVEVFRVLNSTRSSLGVFCGTSAPQPIGSLGGMTIQFLTDESDTDRGWIATYEQSECGGRLTDPSGTITSPSHPQRYISNANCTWIITTSGNMSIKIRFETFNLEAHSLCLYDYVAVYDGPLINSSRLIGKFCGSSNPGEMTSATNAMVVNFISDASGQREGFSAVYTRVYGPASGCGGLINSTSGTIQSLDFNGDGMYEADLSCVWQIIVPQNSSVSLSFDQFNLAPVGCYDYLEVRDGIFETDPVVGRYCGGSDAPGNFTSTTNMVYIKFVTDSAIGAAGFVMRYTATPRLCGTTLYSYDVSALLSSPNYPRAYPPNLICRWTIDAPENERVEVTVTNLDLDNHTNCENTYLEIRDTVTDAATAQLVGETKSILVCGRTLPQPYLSYTRTVTVSFVTGEIEGGQRTGFQLSYKTASCNRTYTASNGWIVSPKYPANYPINANCEIFIQTAPGYKLSLFFAFMDIEPHISCLYDYLQVFNGSQPTSSSVAKLCGSTIPSPIFLAQNNARLVFVTDSSQTHRGFGITYTASESGCGGDLTNPSGVFTSPDYPSNIAYAATCRWSIQVPSRRRLSLTFSIQQSRGGTPTDDCTNSYVTIYDGATTMAPWVTYCTAEGLVTFRAVSNRLIVDFTTSNSTNAANIAFQARYTS